MERRSGPAEPLILIRAAPSALHQQLFFSGGYDLLPAMS